MESSPRVRCSWAGSPCCEVAASPGFPHPAFGGVWPLGPCGSRGWRGELLWGLPGPGQRPRRLLPAALQAGLLRPLCRLRPQELNENVVTSHFWPRISSPFSKHSYWKRVGLEENS